MSMGSPFVRIGRLTRLGLAAALAWAVACSTPPEAPRPAEAPDHAGAGATAPAARPEPPSEPEPEGEPAPPPPSARGLDPLPEPLRAVMLAGPEDTLATTDIHYIQSNEIRHDVWFPYIEGLGRAYVGVGSDQNYTLIGRARSELVFLFDIDQRVVDTHRAYGILIAASETPAELHARFDPKRTEQTVELLEAALADVPEAERKRVIRGYRAGRETLWRHLDRVIKRTRDGQGTTWLSDPASYEHVRTLYRSGRVRLMAGDLTGTHTMQTIAKVLRELEVPVGLLYLSNAEEYFKYVPSYVANIQALPVEPDTIVLRTIYNKEKNKDYVMADSLWHYQVQPLADFQRRLADKANASRNPMISRAEREGVFERRTEVPGLSRLAMPPAAGQRD